MGLVVCELAPIGLNTYMYMAPLYYVYFMHLSGCQCAIHTIFKPKISHGAVQKFAGVMLYAHKTVSCLPEFVKYPIELYRCTLFELYCSVVYLHYLQTGDS